VLSLALVRICRAAAIRMGRVSLPRADRWHRRPVALLGGVGMALALFLTAGWFGLVARLPVLLACTAVIAAIGLIDDLISMKPASKLIAQLAIASVLLFFDYRLYWLQSITLDMLLTLVWIVGITNAFNLLDNMDGLCGGVSIVAGVALLAEMLPAGGGPPPPGVAAQITYLAALLGAIGGFLVYNVHPASIFMGDSGSLLLGFSFAALTLTTGQEIGVRPNLLSVVAVPVLVLLIPIFDTTLVTVSRLVSGRPASQGGRDHSSHRLVAMGLSEPRAVALLWLLAVIGAGNGIALSRYNQSWTLPAAIGFILAMVIFAVYLGGIRVYTSTDPPTTQAVTPLLVEFVYKRRLAEVLLDFMLVTLCYYAAYRLRFENPYEFQANFANFTRSLPVVLAAEMVAFFFVGVYRGVWRQFGLMDAVVIARGVFLGVVTSQLVILYLYRFFSYSRAVFAVNAVLLAGAMIVSRASFRLAGELMQRLRETGTRVVVYGAGDGGALAVRELQGRAGAQYRILGFVDDDRHKVGTRVHGYPVLGDFSVVRALLARRGVDLVVISARTIDGDHLRDLRTVCAANGVGLVRLQVGLEDLVVPIDPPQQASARPRKL
jgi:UDP-GlcNAc:undecaprenyl-phosphate GlcNAc-1-phosphate transferase